MVWDIWKELRSKNGQFIPPLVLDYWLHNHMWCLISRWWEVSPVAELPPPGEELVEVFLGEALVVLHVVVANVEVHLWDKNSCAILPSTSKFNLWCVFNLQDKEGKLLDLLHQLLDGEAHLVCIHWFPFWCGHCYENWYLMMAKSFAQQLTITSAFSSPSASWE